MEDNIINLVDESGKEEEFEILATFGVNDRDYVALIPVESEDDMILMLRIEREKENLALKGIEDQEELNEVIEVFQELQEEIE